MVDTYCEMMSVVAAPAGPALAVESLSDARSAGAVCSLLQTGAWRSAGAL